MAKRKNNEEDPQIKIVPVVPPISAAEEKSTQEIFNLSKPTAPEKPKSRKPVDAWGKPKN